MKIMHVIEGLEGGGIYSFLMDLCNYLTKEHEIIIVYSNRDSSKKDMIYRFDDRIELINVSMRREINFIYDLKSLIKIYKVIKDKKPDILHLHSSKAGVLGRIAGSLLKYNTTNMFYNPHGYGFLQKDVSLIKCKLYYYIEKIIGNINATTIGVSNGEYEEAIKLSKNVEKINNAININELDVYFNPIKKQKDNFTVGTMGRIAPQKNPDLFNEIAKINKNMNFIWIGDGDLREKLDAPNIEITGWVNRHNAIKFLENIDVYIQPSLWEGMPIALLEAMYMEKGVIVTDVVGNRDVIVHGQNGYIAKTAQEFTEYLNKFYNDHDLLSKLSKNSREYIIKNHSIIEMINKYEQLYARSNLVIGRN